MDQPTKPALLFLSPTVPVSRGHGSAMRAFTLLQSLSADYRVYLWVIQLFRTRVKSNFSELYLLIEDAVICYTPTILCLPFPAIRFDVACVYRLVMSKWAELYWTTAGYCPQQRWLDLDDYESKTRRRLAELYLANGEPGLYRQHLQVAKQLFEMERTQLPKFNRVFVCSEVDRVELDRRFGARTATVVPNAVRVSPAAVFNRQQRESHMFLFVATLTYYPNEDAVVFFCRDILPQLRCACAGEVKFSIVGHGCSSRVEALRGLPGVELVGEVEDVRPYYELATAAVVPLRAGGGTRIKILEAFSYRCPVISTGLGAEGLGIKSGHNILLANSAPEFAENCAWVSTHCLEASYLARRAYEFVKANHTFQNVREALTHGPVGGYK